MKNSNPSNRATIGVASALGFLTVLGPASIDMYLPSLPRMAAELNTDYTTMQLTLTVFLLAMGGGQLIFGPVIDAFGRRRPLLIAVASFVGTSLWASYASSPEMLITARFFQGLSASLAIVTAMSSVRDVAEGVRATQIFALLMTIQGLGPVIAPAMGGVIGDYFGWRTVFVVLAGLGTFVFISSFIMLSESLPFDRREKLNLPVVSKTYITILSDRKFLLPALSLATVFTFLFGYIGGSAFAYQKIYGLSASSFGIIFGVTGLAVLLGAMASAKFATKVAVQRLAMAGSLAILIGSLISLISAATSIGLPGIAAGMFIALAGLGIAETTLMSIALATRTTALGSSAAILGAVPLMLGAAATPIAAYVVEQGATPWTLAITAVAFIATILTWQTTRLVGTNNLKTNALH